LGGLVPPHVLTQAGGYRTAEAAHRVAQAKEHGIDDVKPSPLDALRLEKEKASLGGQPHVYVTTTISLAEFIFMKKGQ
jgi:hypothetical protein